MWTHMQMAGSFIIFVKPFFLVIAFSFMPSNRKQMARFSKSIASLSKTTRVTLYDYKPYTGGRHISTFFRHFRTFRTKTEEIWRNNAFAQNDYMTSSSLHKNVYTQGHGIKIEVWYRHVLVRCHYILCVLMQYVQEKI